MKKLIKRFIYLFCPPVIYNFLKKIYKRIKIASSPPDYNKKPKLRIALICNSGIGDMLIIINYLTYIRELAGNETLIDIISKHGQITQPILDVAFANSINNLYMPTAHSIDNNKLDYDIVLNLCSQPFFEKYNSERITRLAPKLLPHFDAVITNEQQDFNENVTGSDTKVFSSDGTNFRKRINRLDIGGHLGMSEIYRFRVPHAINEEKIEVNFDLSSLKETNMSQNLDDVFLPLPPNILRKGRCVEASYRRGQVLDKYYQSIENDLLYKEAYAFAAPYTILGEHRRMNIYLILKYFMNQLPFGHIIEFGSYRGGNAIFMAYVTAKLYPDMKVYGLDTFEGMPPTDGSIDLHRKGNFSDTSWEKVCRLKEELKLDNLIWVKGLFENTANKVISEAGSFRLAHIDCDVYDAVKFSYCAVQPAMVNGGYIVFDDNTSYTCLGSMEATEELLYHQEKRYAEQVWPHCVYRMNKEDQ